MNKKLETKLKKMNMILFKNGMENEHFYIFEHRACVWF